MASDIRKRKEMLLKLTEDCITVSTEKEKAKNTNSLLKQDVSEYRVPHVMDYVDVKVCSHEINSIFDRRDKLS